MVVERTCKTSVRHQSESLRAVCSPLTATFAACASGKEVSHSQEQSLRSASRDTPHLGSRGGSQAGVFSVSGLVDLVEGAGPHGRIASKDLQGPQLQSRGPARSRLKGVAELGAELGQPQQPASQPHCTAGTKAALRRKPCAKDSAPARPFARRRLPLLQAPI